MMKNYVLQKKQKVLFWKKVGVPLAPTVSTALGLHKKLAEVILSTLNGCTEQRKILKIFLYDKINFHIDF